MTAKETQKIITMFLAAYPNLRSLDDEVLAGIEGIWIPILADIPFEVGKLAAQHVLTQRTIPAFPTPGEIRQAAADIMLGPMFTAVEAWGGVMESFARYGSSGAKIKQNLDPVSWSVIESMGLESLYSQAIQMGGDPSKARREFTFAYEKAVKREREVQAMLPQVKERLGIRALASSSTRALEGSGK